MPYAATCHPDRPHRGRGLCQQCYNRDYQKRKAVELAEWRQGHYQKNKEEMNAYNKEWRGANRDKVRSNKASRRAARNSATPNWLTRDQWADIDSIYRKAYLRSIEEGVQYEVDHIIPLRGKMVCGLHVPWNLQVLEATENRKKRNKVKE